MPPAENGRIDAARPEHGRGAALAGFALGAVLALAPLGLPASRWALAATVPALAFILIGAAFALSHRPERRWWPTLGRRLPAVLLLLLLASAGLLLLAGAPAWWLLREGALLPVLGLSVALALAVAALARRWPAVALPLIDAPRCGSTLGLVRRSLREAGALVLADPSPSRGWLAASALLFLLLGPLLLGLAGPELGWALRLGLSLGWTLLAPLVAFVLLALVEPARLGAARTPIPPPPIAPAREPSSAVPIALPAALAADPSARLYAAARGGRIDEALAALDAGADPHALPAPGERDQRSLPVLAAVLGDPRLLRALIARGVDLNQAHAGLTPLLAATRDSLRGRPDSVMTLLANGADPRVADPEGRTPLHFAALSGDPEVAALLLDAGAPLDALNRDGFSPLGVACAAGNWRLAKFLLERKARVEPVGGQPVLLAAASGDDDPAGVDLLLKHKAKPNARGRLGRTALMGASLAGNAQIAERLLAAGADLDARDEHGVGALHEAARAGANAVLACFGRHRPDPACVDQGGRNALLVACRSSAANRDTIAALIALGVDPRQQGEDGRHALDVALAAGRWPLVALLDPTYPLPATLVDHLPASPDSGVDDERPWIDRLRASLLDGPFEQLQRELRAPPAGAGASLIELYQLFAAGLPEAHRRLLASSVALEADALAQAALADRLSAQAAIAPLEALVERGLPVTGSGSLARLLAACLHHGRDGDNEQSLALRLLGAGADPFGGSEGQPALLLAIRLGWHRLLEALLAAGVDPDSGDRQGRSALHVACQQRDADALRLLLRHGAQPQRRSAAGSNALGVALACGDRALADWLDWRGPWPLPRRPLREADLVAAAAVGDEDAVRRLLALGLPVDARDGQGATALLRASGAGHPVLVTQLIASGADPTLTANSGASCLSAAVIGRQAEVVRRLLAAGIAVDQTLPGEITPLMVAAALGATELLRQLLDAGADAARLDAHGNGALHALAQFGFGARDRQRACSAWQALLAAGAAPDARNDAGLSPLLLLLGAGAEPGTPCDEDVLAAQLEVLLTRQLDLDRRDARGFGPLHLAALHGQLRAVRRLLVAGADRDSRDQLNRRPQEIAVMRGFVDIAAELESRSVPAPSLARFLREPQG